MDIIRNELSENDFILSKVLRNPYNKLIVEIDEELHHKFKLYCVKKGLSIREVITLEIVKLTKDIK